MGDSKFPIPPVGPPKSIPCHTQREIVVPTSRNIICLVPRWSIWVLSPHWSKESNQVRTLRTTYGLIPHIWASYAWWAIRRTGSSLVVQVAVCPGVSLLIPRCQFVRSGLIPYQMLLKMVVRTLSIQLQKVGYVPNLKLIIDQNVIWVMKHEARRI